MTLWEALTEAQWVRRKGRPSWMHLGRDDGGERLICSRNWTDWLMLTKADLAAIDWEPHREGIRPSNPDDSVTRFSLLEPYDE